MAVGVLVVSPSSIYNHLLAAKNPTANYAVSKKDNSKEENQQSNQSYGMS